MTGEPVLCNNNNNKQCTLFNQFVFMTFVDAYIDDRYDVMLCYGNSGNCCLVCDIRCNYSRFVANNSGLFNIYLV